MTMTEDIMFKVVERPVEWKDKDGGHHDTGHKALLRVGPAREPVQLAIVKQGYKVITNMEVMDVVTEATKGWKTTVDTYSDQGGAKSFIDVQFKDVHTALNGSEINFRTIFWNGFGNSSFGAHIGTINAFCTNGQILGTKETTYKRHTKGLDPGIAHGWITQGLKTFNVVHQTWVKWLQQPVDQEQILSAINQMVEHDIQRIKLIDLHMDKYTPKYGLNLFSIHQTLTDYATHYEDYRLRAANSNSRNSRSFELLKQAEHIINQMAA
jgi:hypothetical protein